MHDLNDIYFFVRVVDHGGFAPAGRALRLPKSRLSRRIALLEERLGVRLIQRSTRHFSVTDIGQTYYRHCRAMLVEAQAAQEAIDLSRSAPRGIVRMTCPVALLHARVAAMLAEFMGACPDVVVELEATNRRVDPVGEGLDLALRVRPPPLEDSDLAMRVLGERSQCLVASPALVERLSEPATAADLKGWPSLGLGSLQDEHGWRLLGPDGTQVLLPHEPRFASADMTALRHAALAGVGVVQLPTMMVRAELAQGTLVRLLPGWAPRPEIIHVVFASRRGLLPSVRTLIDHLAQRFAALDED